ncbi:hypothetical protein BH09PSE2_BH09PSE2_08100 [soil metagenome]
MTTSTERAGGSDWHARSALITGGVIGVVALVRLCLIALRSEAQIVQMVPDDAFYYLVLAKEHAATGRWTFDGVAPTTGFHLLWGYLLSALYSVAPGAGFRLVFCLSGLIGAACTAAACALTALAATRIGGRAAALGVAAIFAGSAALTLPTFIMEGPLALLFAAAVTFLGLRLEPSQRAAVIAAALACGVLGMLSRSDLGIVPGAIFLVQALRVALGRLHWRGALVPAAALLGSVIGLGLVLLHTHAVSGGFVQASAAVKAHWSALAGNGFARPTLLVLGVAAPSPLALLGAQTAQTLAMTLALGALAAFAVVSGRIRGETLLLACAPVLTLLLYVALYSRNTEATQPWYAANLLVPSAVIGSVVLAPWALRWRTAALVAAALFVGISAVMSLRPLWPAQASMREAGLTLRREPALAPVGGWNVGLVSYFAARPVLNLDGLVNDAILPHLTPPTLLDYVRERRIRYLVDFSAMMDASHMARGGYGDGKLAACTAVVKPLATTEPRNLWHGSVETLYAVKPDCPR